MSQSEQVYPNLYIKSGCLFTWRHIHSRAFHKGGILGFPSSENCDCYYFVMIPIFFGNYCIGENN